MSERERLEKVLDEAEKRWEQAFWDAAEARKRKDAEERVCEELREQLDALEAEQ